MVGFAFSVHFPLFILVAFPVIALIKNKDMK